MLNHITAREELPSPNSFLKVEALRSTLPSGPQSVDEVVTCEKSRGSVSPRSSFAAQMGEDGREMPMGRKGERVTAAKKAALLTPACLATFLGRTDQILNFKFNGEPNPTPKQVAF